MKKYLVLFTIIVNFTAINAFAGQFSIFTLSISCESSFRDVQEVLSQVSENCYGKFNPIEMSSECSGGKKSFVVTFEGSMCNTNYSGKKTGTSDCQKTIKVAKAVDSPTLCVSPNLNMYKIYLSGKDDIYKKRVDTFSKEVSETIKAAGCQMDGEPLLSETGGEYRKGNSVGFVFPSKNCYLLDTREKNCLSGYESVRLYPVYDAKDSSVGRYVCRLKGSKAAKATGQEATP